MSPEHAPAAPHSELVSSAAHVFVEDLGSPCLAARDLNHLARALRLRPGELVTASDGAGGWRRCVWSGAALAADGPVVAVGRPEPAVCIGFALTKGDRPERVVRGLTEAGVDRIVPFSAARSVVRWDGARAETHVEGLRRVSREAAMQSRCVWLPEVTPLVGLRDLLELDGGCGPSRLEGPALAQMGGSTPSLDRPCILVGPEGGWDPGELAYGIPLVGLGAGVMRAETAALAAGIILCGLRGGVVDARPNRPR